MALFPTISVMTIKTSILLSYTLTSSTCIQSNLCHNNSYFSRLHDDICWSKSGGGPASALSILHGLGGQYNCLEYSRSVEEDICEAVRYFKMVVE